MSECQSTIGIQLVAWLNQMKQLNNRMSLSADQIDRMKQNNNLPLLSWTSAAFEISELFLALASMIMIVVLIVIMKKNKRVNRKLMIHSRNSTSEQFKQIVYGFLLAFNLSILLEFGISWSYFWLTQVKLLVFTLAYVSQTLTIIYMVYMAS